MQTHKPKIEPYESDTTKVTTDGVLGISYLVTRSDSKLSGTTNLRNAQLGDIKLTKIEMYLNMRIQTFLVQKMGVTGISKYTFNEITVAKISKFKIDAADYENNQADNRF